MSSFRAIRAKMTKEEILIDSLETIRLHYNLDGVHLDALFDKLQWMQDQVANDDDVSLHAVKQLLAIVIDMGPDSTLFSEADDHD